MTYLLRTFEFAGQAMMSGQSLGKFPPWADSCLFPDAIRLG
jgi:hypothetical protein